MQDYELAILEKYHINVKSTRKTRGAFFCDTDEGLLLLREAGMSGKRIPALYRLCGHLIEQGYIRVDQMVANEDGEYVSTSEDGTRYILKHWFYGRECDIRRNGEVLEAARNLAKLHLLMHGCIEGAEAGEPYLREEYLRHNRELRKVRKFMRAQSPKGEFELAFLECFDAMYGWAEAALTCLEDFDYKGLYRESMEKNSLIHGDYNYHNILMTPEGIAVTNFDRFRGDVQAEDLYYFLRKAMEKHGWDKKLGDHILNVYGAVRPISGEEMEYLKVRFVYPEKFWKTADSYYRSNKAWISVKSVEKLKVAMMQTEEKKDFLENIFSFRL